MKDSTFQMPDALLSHISQEALRPIIATLHLKTYRDKLLDTCYPSPHEYRRLMETWEGGQLKEWRWSSLTDVLRALLRREKALRECWDSKKFGHPVPSGPDIGATIGSSFFWCYCHFLALISGMVDSESQWCEGCSCHEDWARHKGHRSRQKYLREKLQHFAAKLQDPHGGEHPVSSCPLKGRRAPDFASGAFSTFTEDLVRVSREQFDDCAKDLPSKERAALLQDWLIATDPGQPGPPGPQSRPNHNVCV